MKAVVINTSPRKAFNTAQLLKEAARGVESVGGEVMYVNLHDLDCAGCHSCMLCKRRGLEDPCHCFWKDGLTPVIEEIYQADRLIIGSPVYFYEPSSGFRALLERVCFPALSYNDYTSTFAGRVDVDVVFTMNVSREYYDNHYRQRFEDQLSPFAFLNGRTRILASCDTTQVKDYSRYEMARWDPEHKREVRETDFRSDLELAFQMGARTFQSSI